MGKDKPVEATPSDTPAPVATPQNLVSDQDMSQYSKIVKNNTLDDSLPDVAWIDSAAQGGTERPRYQTLPAFGGEGGRAQLLPMPAEGSIDGRLRTMPARPGDEGIVRIRPGGGFWGEPGDQPRRPGELPPDMIRDFQRHLDDMVLGPPEAMEKLPTAEQQKLYREQAKYIAGVIGKNGDFYAGLKRENVEAMFEAATRGGEENLNYLVRAVNAELAKTNPNLQLGYNFKSEKAWFSKDTHGADIYISPVSVDENRSTVALINRSNNTIETEDRIRSKASAYMPGYFRSSDPHAKLIPVLE